MLVLDTTMIWEKAGLQQRKMESASSLSNFKSMVAPLGITGYIVECSRLLLL